MLPARHGPDHRGPCVALLLARRAMKGTKDGGGTRLSSGGPQDVGDRPDDILSRVHARGEALTTIVAEALAQPEDGIEFQRLSVFACDAPAEITAAGSGAVIGPIGWRERRGVAQVLRETRLPSPMPLPCAGCRRFDGGPGWMRGAKRSMCIGTGSERRDCLRPARFAMC